MAYVIKRTIYGIPARGYWIDPMSLGNWLDAWTRPTNQVGSIDLGHGWDDRAFSELREWEWSGRIYPHACRTRCTVARSDPVPSRGLSSMPVDCQRFVKHPTFVVWALYTLSSVIHIGPTGKRRTGGSTPSCLLYSWLSHTECGDTEYISWGIGFLRIFKIWR